MWREHLQDVAHSSAKSMHIALPPRQRSKDYDASSNGQLIVRGWLGQFKVRVLSAA